MYRWEKGEEEEEEAPEFTQLAPEEIPVLIVEVPEEVKISKEIMPKGKETCSIYIQQ